MYSGDADGARAEAVDDTPGQAAGDELLRQVAARLLRRCDPVKHRHRDLGAAR